MNAKTFLCFVALTSGAVDFAHAGLIDQVGDPTGTFEPPISDSQTGDQCPTPGSKRDQYHMQWNDDINPATGNPINKYHMGEDINGKCRGAADEDYPLRAIANGEVVYLDEVDNNGKGKQLYIRYSIPYATVDENDDDVLSFDSAYLHINDINPSKVWWSGPGTGSTVEKHDIVAYLGGTGGWTPHLHWEIQWDDDPNLLTVNNYQNPLAKSHALKFRSPSLIVDDRRDERVYLAPTDGYRIFTMSGNAPSSTAYMEYSGELKSLNEAISAGWMEDYHLLFEDDGTWYYYYDINKNFFENGQRYAVSSNVGASTLHIPVPRNGYQPDRARLDMLLAVENDNRFIEVQTDQSGTEAPWSANSSWNIHWMRFKLTGNRTAYVNQVTSRSNPLIRYTCFYDPDLGQWTSWKKVDWNQLY